MRTLAVRFGVAALACLVGIVASQVFSDLRGSRSNDQCCQNSLVTVEENYRLPELWPRTPARISVSGVQRSHDLSEVDITFAVQSLDGKSITGFDVWAVKSHDKVVYEHKRILVHSTPQQDSRPSMGAAEYRETVSVPLDRGFLRDRIDNVQLYLGSVEFADGTRWHRPWGCGSGSYPNSLFLRLRSYLLG